MAFDQRLYNLGYRSKVREIIDRAKDAPCADCGLRYAPYVMEFDHRDATQKSFRVSSISNSVTRTKAEIAKCDLVCGNCHNARTYRRAQAKKGPIPQ